MSPSSAASHRVLVVYLFKEAEMISLGFKHAVYNTDAAQHLRDHVGSKLATDLGDVQPRSSPTLIYP